MVHLLPSFFISKSETGSARTARRLSPCGGHLLCLMSESSIDDSALEAGPLQGGLPSCVTYKGKA